MPKTNEIHVWLILNSILVISYCIQITSKFSGIKHPPYYFHLCFVCQECRQGTEEMACLSFLVSWAPAAKYNVWGEYEHNGCWNCLELHLS